jgi:hypothetical protein
MEENLPEGHSVHLKYHMNWCGMELRPPLWPSSDQPSKGRKFVQTPTFRFSPNLTGSTLRIWQTVNVVCENVRKETVRSGICHIFPADSRGSWGSFSVVTTAHVLGAHPARCTILRAICLCSLSSICLMEHCRGARWRHFLAAPRQPHRWDNCVRTTLHDPYGMVSHCRSETGRIRQTEVQTRQGMNDCWKGGSTPGSDTSLYPRQYVSTGSAVPQPSTNLLLGGVFPGA